MLQAQCQLAPSETVATTALVAVDKAFGGGRQTMKQKDLLEVFKKPSCRRVPTYRHTPSSL
jgi:hypothetical protein